MDDSIEVPAGDWNTIARLSRQAAEYADVDIDTITVKVIHDGGFYLIYEVSWELIAHEGDSIFRKSLVTNIFSADLKREDWRAMVLELWAQMFCDWVGEFNDLR